MWSFYELLGVLKMDYRDRILWTISHEACELVTMRTIRQLRQSKDSMQSGEDSGLKNLWDEVCVQVQGEESVFWSAYLEHIEAIAEFETSKLSVSTKQAMWLQTECGMGWPSDDEQNEICPYSDNDIALFVVQDYILSAAANYNNKRIRLFLDRSYLT